MSKSRTLAKYAAATAVTGLYGAATYKVFSEMDIARKPYTMESVRQVAVGASVLTALTWLCAAL